MDTAAPSGDTASAAGGPRTGSAAGGPTAGTFAGRTAWDRPGFLLWHATLRWQREVAEALRPLELTHVQFVLLAGTAWLTAHGGPPSQRELADHAGTDPMMTSQVARALERRGLVRRREDPRDARIRRLECTAEGLALAERAIVEVLRDLAGRDADGSIRR
jgi:DNA-binding MarR family transcriptional regulator